MIDVPPPMMGWLNALPQQNVGTLYAKIRPPLSPIGFWYRVPLWGQVCDGQPHEGAVSDYLHNEFPFRGVGWTYVEWRCEPDNPEQNKFPRTGKVPNPKPHTNPLR